MPGFDDHIGRSVRLVPIGSEHVDDLWQAAHGADASWTYLGYGPFAAKDDLSAHVAAISRLPHQPFFAVIPTDSGKAQGWASFCDVAPDHAAIEIGSIWFSPSLQRTRAATEAIHLMMSHAFALGYHRLVWRCNALNAASLRAAERYGFVPEGIWRGERIIKGHRRDTAWFSLLAPEWPAQRELFRVWLDDANFDAAGLAKRSLRVEARR